MELINKRARLRFPFFFRSAHARRSIDRSVRDIISEVVRYVRAPVGFIPPLLPPRSRASNGCPHALPTAHCPAQQAPPAAAASRHDPAKGTIASRLGPSTIHIMHLIEATRLRACAGA